MSKKPLRVGVAGCGQYARALHIPGYVNCPKARLVALYNHRLDTVADLRRKYPDAEMYDDYERFLDSSGVQAISICSPNALHAKMTISALKRGIHVLVEKPMAVTLTEAQAMIETAHKSGALLMVSQTERYVPRQRKAFQIIQSGVLGRIFQVRTTLGHSGPLDWSPRGRWFVTAKLAGTGVIGDLGVHQADLLRYLTGQEVECVAAFKSAFETQEVEDNAVAVLQLSGGTMATLSTSWTVRGKMIDDFIFVGEGGSLRLGVEPGSPVVMYKASDERVVYQVPEGIPKTNGALQLDEVPEFVDAVLGERPNPIPGEEGYRALEICIAIDQSARTGALVRLPLSV